MKTISLPLLALSFCFLVFSLHASYTITAVQDGNWNDHETWDKWVPKPNDKVIIPDGITIEIHSPVVHKGKITNNGGLIVIDQFINHGYLVNNDIMIVSGIFINYGSFDNFGAFLLLETFPLVNIGEALEKVYNEMHNLASTYPGMIEENMMSDMASLQNQLDGMVLSSYIVPEEGTQFINKGSTENHGVFILIGDVWFNNGKSFVNYDTFIAVSGVKITNNGTFINEGDFIAVDDVKITNNGKFINKDSFIAVDVKITNNGKFINKGLFIAAGVMITHNGTFINEGDINAVDVMITHNGTFINEGDIIVVGALIQNCGFYSGELPSIPVDITINPNGDADNDFVDDACDCNTGDPDPAVSIVGAKCDDGNPETDTDILGEDCMCQGFITIPTISQWGLIILGLCLYIFGMVAVRQNVFSRIY